MNKNTIKSTSITEARNNVSAASKTARYLKGKNMNTVSKTKMESDSFDTANLKFKPKAKKILKTIPSKKISDEQDFVSVHADDRGEVEVLTFRDEKTGEHYFVAHALHGQHLAVLRLAASQDDAPFVWITSTFNETINGTSIRLWYTAGNWGEDFYQSMIATATPAENLM